jgi:hypothetical protein
MRLGLTRFFAGSLKNIDRSFLYWLKKTDTVISIFAHPKIFAG